MTAHASPRTPSRPEAFEPSSPSPARLLRKRVPSPTPAPHRQPSPDADDRVRPYLLGKPDLPQFVLVRVTRDKKCGFFLMASTSFRSFSKAVPAGSPFKVTVPSPDPRLGFRFMTPAALQSLASEVAAVREPPSTLDPYLPPAGPPDHHELLKGTPFVLCGLCAPGTNTYFPAYVTSRQAQHLEDQVHSNWKLVEPNEILKKMPLECFGWHFHPLPGSS